MAVKEYIRKMFWGFYSLSPAELFELACDLKWQMNRVAKDREINEVDICHSLLNVMDLVVNDNHIEEEKSSQKEGAL